MTPVPLFRGRVLPLCCCAAMLLLSAGCGYSHQALFPQDVRTVAVPIFENRTRYRGMERDLTEALIKELETRGTQLKVVRSAEADTILTGSITDVRQRVLSLEPVGGLPQDVEVTIVVSFEWKNQRTGVTLRDRRGFPTVGRYSPARTIGEPFETAQHEAVQQTARDIVTAMQVNW